MPEAFSRLNISSTTNMVANRIKILNVIFKKIACMGRDFISSNLPAPKYCEIIADMALRVCPKIHINIDKKVPTMPAAARDSEPFTGILPTMAVSVIDKRGSAIPAIVAGIASLLILLKLIFNGFVVKSIIK